MASRRFDDQLKVRVIELNSGRQAGVESFGWIAFGYCPACYWFCTTRCVNVHYKLLNKSK